MPKASSVYGQLERKLICMRLRTSQWEFQCQCLCLCLRMGLLLLLLSPIGRACASGAWKCLYKEFPVDTEKIKGGWWIYGTNPGGETRCYLDGLNLYWTRITMTDYDNYAVELHCSLPWFKHLMAIYTRTQEPTQETLNAVAGYLRTVRLSLHNFTLVAKPENCVNQSHGPWQRWYLARYLHLEYHPHYLKPLIDDENI
ncbi:uncharacterized protein [Drosophila pseudoobscura]|uniref:Uncharacterized protein n=1 Tax=Drosophila pseudoobscura pseudoobscura TaxID=46245 RepID=A0A6I8V1D5_DROPS|nr:uncharacterized protein LOC6900234 [Drosophila pseudoobscura]